MLKILTSLILMAGFASAAWSSQTPRAPDPAFMSAPTVSPLVERVAAEDVKILIVVKGRKRHGNSMDVAFDVRVENLPPGRKYQFLLQDLGMKTDGLPPAPVPNRSHRWVPDGDATLRFNFQVGGFVRGEWIQFTIRSTDGQITKTVRYVPFE